jgi:hypothetical protein
MPLTIMYIYIYIYIFIHPQLYSKSLQRLRTVGSKTVSCPFNKRPAARALSIVASLRCSLSVHAVHLNTAGLAAAYSAFRVRRQRRNENGEKRWQWSELHWWNTKQEATSEQKKQRVQKQTTAHALSLHGVSAFLRS